MSFWTRLALVLSVLSLTSVVTATTASAVGTPGADVAPSVAPTLPLSAQQGHSVTGPTINAKDCWYDNHWWCDTRYYAPVYRSGTSTIVGRITWNPARYWCRSDNGGHVGGPHPNRWEWSPTSDTGESGWVKDTDIYNETDPLPVC